MVPMMVEILVDLKTGESEEDLRAIVEEFVGRLTGKQTMYQMIELAEKVEARGGKPLDPLEYKNDVPGPAAREDPASPGGAGVGRGVAREISGARRARAARSRCKARGLKMYLASGTDQVYMREEAQLLDVDRYFDGGVFGALDDYKSFSKKILIQQLIATAECQGDQFLGFGDGYVEIENVKEVGGVAVGVATAEPECLVVDEWKRKRLAGVGADFIIPNFLCHRELLGTLFPNGQ